ncbi:UNVERIFIED_CONTAM: Signal peptidase complex catalytic subunit SEC11C [Trichonephila clavipes]
MRTLLNGMEPALRKGDIFFVTNCEEDTLNVGDIILFDVKSQEIPIVHRIIQIRTKARVTCRELDLTTSMTPDCMKINDNMRSKVP